MAARLLLLRIDSQYRPSDMDDRGLENLLSWIAASVVVSYAVVAGGRVGEDRRRVAAGTAASAAAEGGATARTPFPLSARGFGSLLWRTYERIERHRILLIAAGVAFYSLLALFPAITAGVSLYALFADPHMIGDHLSLLAGIVPSSALDIVRDEITRIAAQSNGKLTFGFLFGFALALWSANAGVKAIFDALNIIHDQGETRGFVRLSLISLLFTIGAIAFVLLTVAAVVVLPLALNVLGLPALSDSAIVYLRWPALLALSVLSIAILYRSGPRSRRAWALWPTLGSVFAALLWLAVSAALSWYLGNFANYNATYGALGAVIGLMMWMWLSLVIVLAGAELDAVIEPPDSRAENTPIK
jgi:membrane protein